MKQKTRTAPQKQVTAHPVMQEIAGTASLVTKEEVHKFWVESANDFLLQKETGINISQRQDCYWKYLDIWEKQIALDNSSGEIILDLGAGTGRITEFLRANGKNVIPVDYVFEALAVIDRTLPIKSCANMDVTKIALKDSSVSCVVSCRVLQSLPTRFEKEEAIGEIARILKPKGRLVLTEGNPLRVRLAPVPYNFYISIGQWRRLLTKHGFIVDAVYGIPFLTAVKLLDRMTFGLSRNFSLPSMVAHFLDKLFRATPLKHISLQYDLIATKK